MKPGVRARLRRWHLVLGLTAGAVFALAGVTGSALVFYLELDGLLNPALVDPAPAAPARSLEDLYGALRAAHPTRTGAWRLEFPADRARRIQARYYTPVEARGRLFAPLIATIDPVTAQVVDSRLWGRHAVTWLYDLHYTLLLDRAGRTLLGVLGVAMLAGLVIGLALAWPRTPRWREVLRLRPRHGAARRVFDLHRAAGLYGLVVSALLVVTGVCLALPATVHPLLERMSPLYVAPALHSTREASPRIPLDAAVAAAQRRFPAARLAWVETPADADGVYRINLAQSFEPSMRFPRTNVWVDQYSGHVLAVRDPRRDGAGDVILNWLHPLHNGEVFGLAGRVIVCAAGLVPALLFATGLLRWRQKRRAARRIAART